MLKRRTYVISFPHAHIIVIKYSQFPKISDRNQTRVDSGYLRYWRNSTLKLAKPGMVVSLCVSVVLARFDLVDMNWIQFVEKT